MQSRFKLFFVLGVTFIISSIVFAQGPSKAQVIKAQRYFSDKGILVSLVDLTKADSEQATRFSDVITACYDIFQVIDQMAAKQSRDSQRFQELEEKIAELQVSLMPLQQEEKSPEISEEVIAQISHEIKAQMSETSSAELKSEYEKIDQQLTKVIYRLKQDEDQIQKIKIISISSAVFTCLVGLLAAL